MWDFIREIHFSHAPMRKNASVFGSRIPFPWGEGIGKDKRVTMDLWQLRYFVCAAEHLNFTKAAESLHISQSALSKKISDLENHFGVQLFLRGKQSLSLTMAGQVFLNESRSILGKWDQTSITSGRRHPET